MLTQPGGTPKTWTVGYDGAGNLQQLLAPNNTNESWGYDSAYRLLSRADWKHGELDAR